MILLLFTVLILASCLTSERKNPGDVRAVNYSADLSSSENLFSSSSQASSSSVAQSSSNPSSSSSQTISSSSSPTSSSSGIITGTVTDSRDGKIYKTVVIGTQTWMAENLNYDTAEGTGSWCYDNLSAKCDTYGRLYDWNTLMAGASTSSANPSGVRGICPSAWHVPSDAEREVLAQYVAEQTGNNGKSGDDWTQLG